ncbi:MAG TPA: DUF4173 domain-containing protein [Actinophytocola sp.]|uniref:DUF4153 domain-containing protein n=1 Tax=Actinophytocola sp. TaxID=1872138 RepID=UPI002DB701D0|nr:DUF4173 domain-containing protein [Actinophytocola sp.]HEU5472625.1 DUF4173 domain-containing protein [Actinophytocola sp.]
MTDTAAPAGPKLTASKPVGAAPIPPRGSGRTAWPGPSGAASSTVLIGAGAAGLAAAVAAPDARPGIGALLIGLAIVAAVLPAGLRRGGPPSVERFLWTAATLALLGVGVLRAAEWLFAVCLLAALVTTALALTRARTVAGIQAALVCLPLACLRAVPWAGRGLAAVRARLGSAPGRLARSVAVTALLVVVFGALFAGADAAFANLVGTVVPTVDGGSVIRRAVLFAVVAVATSGAAFLLTAPPALDRPAAARTPVRRFEWTLPLGVLLIMFGAFVLVQLTVLFGGREYMVRTSGLTAAAYARQGFWQLCAVTVLALVVIGVAARRAPRATRADRIWLRALLGGLAGLTLVIVASALTRLWAYQESFGYSVLRLLVGAGELWLGAVYLMVIAAGVRLRAGWLPRAVLGSAVGALLLLAVVNPEGYVAERNIARYEHTGKIDLDYLATLSADATPELARLPDPARSCVLVRVRARLTAQDPWHTWNLARATARDLITDAYLRPCR